uniref:Uncharacterized protein n=1 Tax=Cyanistes caeruleus TaxID=156563 RepID=A0A8C0UYL2_CYACU
MPTILSADPPQDTFQLNFQSQGSQAVVALHCILFNTKDLNRKLQTTRGTQYHSYADVLLLEQAVWLSAVCWRWKNRWSCEQTPSSKYITRAVAQRCFLPSSLSPTRLPDVPCWEVALFKHPAPATCSHNSSLRVSALRFRGSATAG